MRTRPWAPLALLLALLTGPVQAQTAQPVVPGQLTGVGCGPNVTTCFAPSTPATPLEVVSTTFSAGSSTTLSAGTTTSNVALPSNGSITEIANGGAVTAYVSLGVGSGTTAKTTTGYAIPAGWTIFVYTGSATYLAGITASSTATLTVTSGNLSPISSGGGGPTSNVDVAQFGGSNTVTGTGASGAGVPRVTVANDSNFGVAQGSTTSGQVGPLIQCATTTSSPTNTTAQTNPLSCDTTGALRISAPPASPINVIVNTPPNDVLTGPITCSAACAATTQVSAQGSGSVGIVATGSGTALSYTFQASVDGSTWFSVPAYTPAAAVVAPGTAITSATGQWTVPASGWRFVRVNLTAIGSGSEVFNVNASAGSVVPPGASITVNAPPNDVLVGPTNFTGAGDQIVNSQGAGSVGLQITGTFTGLSGLVRASIDGTNYFNVPAFNTTSGTAVTPGTAITGIGSWFIPAAGWRFVEYHVTAVSTGTAVVSLNSSAGSIQPLITPSGASNVDIGGVNGATVSTGNGAADTHTIRVAVANNNSAQAVTTAPSTGTTTDKAGTITSGGTAQTAIALNAARKQWCIQNPNSATEDLFVRANGTASATTGADLPPGMQVCSSPTVVDTAAVSVFAATTSHAFLGFEVQ